MIINNIFNNIIALYPTINFPWYTVDLLTWAVAACFLSVAAYQDHKTTYVSNTIWKVFLVFSCATFIIRFGPSPFYTILAFTGVGLALFFFYIIRLGGADAKAYICLAIAFPMNFFLMIMFSAIVSMIYLHLKHKTLNLKKLNNKPFAYLPALLTGYIITFIIIIIL